jgi:hypothetical protein
VTIFTLLSLVLAISGATYTASTAFRNVFLANVGAWEKENQEIWKECAPKLPNGVRRNGNWYACGGTFGAWLWKFSHTIPIAYFMLLAFGIAFWIVGLPFFGRDLASVTALKVEAYWLTTVRWFLVTNIVCFVLTAVGVFLIWNSHRHMANIQKDFDGKQAKGFGDSKIILPD